MIEGEMQTLDLRHSVDFDCPDAIFYFSEIFRTSAKLQHLDIREQLGKKKIYIEVASEESIPYEGI